MGANYEKERIIEAVKMDLSKNLDLVKLINTFLYRTLRRFKRSDRFDLVHIAVSSFD